MTQTDFIAKLRQAEAQPAPSETPHPRPGARATTRAERLERALARIDRAGISPAQAYSPFFRALTGIGLIAKPLRYRSFAGLAFFNFMVITLLFAGAIVAGLSLGAMPRLLTVMLAAGPIGMLTINALLALGVAAVIRGQARRAGLPRWRDL